MPSAVIGALRVDLNLGTAGWQKGLKDATNDARSAAGQFKAVGGTITSIGAGLTAGITAPLVGIGAAAIKTAANFETAMNKLGIATQATGAEMQRMNDLALELGKSTVFSASEAAGAMEELAKNGVAVSDILGGAAKAAVDLAAATGSALEPAAVAVSDAMNQFKLSAADLPMVVNQITGAVNESKLDFADFQLGMAQAGGVAGGLGVSFKDFNAVLAGTSSLFSSGSDAGTAFKTFLTSFVPRSKAAAAAMQEYGLTFFDANGQMRSMTDIAGMLQEKLGGLDDKAKNDVLSTIFGVDSMRTAIGLMNLGAEGLDKIAGKIAATDAAAQSADRMKGLNAQLEQLGGSLETLAIKIGQTGLLTTVTSVVGAVTDLIDRISDFSPAAGQMAVAGAAIAAAIGPIMMVVGPLVSGVGSLVGLFSGWSAALGTASAAAGGLLPLLAPLLPVIAAVAAAAGAAYLVWDNWETIAPILSDLWQTIQQSLGPPLVALFDALWPVIKLLGENLLTVGGILLEAFGPVAVGVIKAAAAVIGGAIKLIGGFLQANILLLRGDFAGAWAATKDALGGYVGGMIDAARALRDGVLGFLGNMVTGIYEALVNRLGGVWRSLKGNIEAAKQWFFGLYDAVVGHSYIPDMVDGIAAHMARLEGVMVKPAREATTKAKDAFKKLRDDLAPLLNELFPESRALVDLQRKLDVIKRAEKAGVANGGLSPEQAEEARRRAMLGPDYQAKRDAEVVDIKGQIAKWSEIDLVPLGKGLDDLKVKLPDLSRAAEDTTAKMIESFAGMARDVLGSLRGMVSAFKGGDILGGLSGLLDIVTQVAGLIRGTGAPRQAVTVTGGSLPYGGGRALGGPVVPGKRYRVGERGRGEWFEPSVPGRITPDAAGGSRGNVYHLQGNLLTPEGWDMIRAMDDGAAIRGAAGGAQLAHEQAAYARSRFL